MYENIFRTFCRGKDKASAESHKGIDHVRDWKDCQRMKSFGGILHPDFIDVSFDDADMGKQFLKMADANKWQCTAIENPENHHIHTFWKTSRKWRNGQDKTLAVGFVADIHSGETYIPIRVNDVTREAVRTCTECQELPEELWPVKTELKFWQMAEGKGRNNDLYKYILTLCKNEKMDRETVRRVIRNINAFVLASPLEKDEIDTILRDEAFPDEEDIIASDFFNGSSFLHAKFARHMIETFHACVVGKQVMIYQDDHYVSEPAEIERAMVNIVYTLKDSQRKEVMKSIALFAPEKEIADPRYIAFKNGIFDLKTNEFLKNSPDFVIENIIPWNYNPRAESSVMDQMLNKISCQDRQIRQLLEEMVGYTFLRRNEMRKAFMLVGAKRNGKSTFLDCIKFMLGSDNYSALDLADLGDRFRTAMIVGKLANIGDDIGDDFLQGAQMALFKKITAGNEISAERKGMDPFKFHPYVKLMFSANSIPRMRDRTGAALDRLVIVPFNATFDKDDPDYDPFIKDKLLTREGMEYLIAVGVEGLKRVLSTREFSHSDAVDEALDNYNRENNSMAGFFEDADIETDIIGKSFQEVMLQYQQYCSENGFERSSGGTALGKYMKMNYGITTKQMRKNGLRARICVFDRDSVTDRDT